MKNTNKQMEEVSNYSQNDTEENKKIYLCTKKKSWDKEDVLEYYLDYSYDIYGNITCEKAFDSSGTPGVWEEYTYDDKGNMISEKVYNYDGSIDYYKELKYDSNGRVIKENVYNAPDFDECISVVREYNTQGKKSKETTYMDEEEISNIFCTYDEKDRLTRVDYSYHGSIGNWEKYIYDSNVVSVECYDSSGDLTRIYQETWSSDGSIEEEKVFDENGCLTEWKQYHYDCGKLKDKVILNSDGSKEKIYIYEYDVNNNLESENIMYTNGEFDILYSCEYELFEVESY